MIYMNLNARDERLQLPNASSHSASGDPMIFAAESVAWFEMARRASRTVYSLHPPEAASARGKVHRRYEFGVKVSIATMLIVWKGGHNRPRQGALPYDGPNPNSGYRRSECGAGGEESATSPPGLANATSRRAHACALSR